MRASAFATSLALLLGASTGAVAQARATSPASPARPTAPVARPVATAPATALPREVLAPAPPTFYSVGRLGEHLWTVRWELAAIGGAVLAIGIRDWDWGGSEFRFIEEGWFGKNTRHGGMDKIGHAFSTFVIADILTERISASATNPTGAPLSGALIAFGIMTGAEALDGFTGRHRFSREDVAANAIGAAFAVLRNSIPGLREKLDWRIMYTPARDELPGVSTWEAEIIPPYDRQRYIMALKGSGFEALQNTPLRYAELHAGFDARGFERNERALGHPIRRNFYVGVGLNLNEVLFAEGPIPNFAGYRSTLPARVVQKAFEYVQVPYTAAYHRTRFSTVRRTPGDPEFPRIR